MRVLRVVGALALLAVGGMAAAAEVDREGSLPDELAAHKPPVPNEISVCVLPSWSRHEGQREMARACTMLNLMRHGFRLAPGGCTSLSQVARKTDAALKRDPEWEPLVRLQAEDAARVGKTLGADWVMFGEYGDLHTESEGGGILPRKVGVIDFRFVLVEVKSGEVLYWSRVKDSEPSGGGLWPAKATSVERRAVTRTINEIFEDIAAALPEHYAGPEVTSEEVRMLMEAMGK